MQKLLNVAKTTGAIVALGALVMSCAGDKGEINRVQPGYVKKSDIIGGSWYYRRTVVDAPETMAPYASIGTGDLFTIERIRWDVQEDYLIAYRDYEFTPGAEEANQPGSDYYGSPVVAFPITSHFDIQNSYNASTGEQTNVVSENTSDRVWHERTYMRIDWSKGNNNSWDFIIPVDVLDTNGQNGSQFYVYENDATNPYRARIEPQNGFVDFVRNHFVESDPYTCYDTFDFQMNPWVCGAGEIRVRHAFMKVDPKLNAGYDPLHYPDSITVKDADGNEVIDPATGEVKREGIYDRFGFYRLERLTYDNLRDLTEQGRINRAIRFDIWKKSVNDDGTVIPYNQREVAPIVYYLNAGFPEDLKATAIEVAAEWNQVFKNTVSTLQGKDVSTVGDVYILRDNTCTASGVKNFLNGHPDIKDAAEEKMGGKLTDDSLASHLTNWCATAEYLSQGDEDRFVWQQNGDPRFNMMYWVPNITPSGFSGYGPMLADPETGRIVVSSAYVMGWTIEDAATRALEYIDYINGELDINEVVLGQNLPYNGAFFTPNGADILTLDSVQALAKKAPSAEFLASLDARVAGLGSSPEELLTQIDNSSHFADRLARVKGTALEQDYLVRQEDLMLASRGSWQPGTAVDAELLDKASFGLDMRANQARADKTKQFLQERTFCPVADLDGALVGLAKDLKDKPRAERRQALRAAIFKAVMLHEVGHNLGLRHNFEASYDALNFHDEFWNLEEALNGDEDAKLDARQPEFKYSSIMDYHGRINADFQGLGKYDNAAIKFGYGQIIEQFKNVPVEGGRALKEWRQLNDYTKLPDHLGSLTQMRERNDVIWNWNQPGLTADDIAEITDTEVPYLYCSDEFAMTTPTCKRFDFGANQREMMQAAILRYRNYTIFTNYLRNRLVVNWGATERGYNVFRDVVMTYQYWYLYRARNTDFLETDLGVDMVQAFVDGFNLMSEVISQPEPGHYYGCTFDEGSPAEQKVYYPEYYVGTSYRPDGSLELVAVDEGETCDTDDYLFVQVGEAHPLFISFTEDWVAWTYSYLGTYWDKQSAIMELADPWATFYRIDQNVDLRTFSVSPYRVFDREILGMMDRLIRFDTRELAAAVNPDPGPTQRLLEPPLLFDSSQALPDVGGPAPVAGNQPRIYPALARNLQRFAALYGMALLTSPLDDTLDFAKYTRVTLKGGQDDLAVFDRYLDGNDDADLPGNVAQEQARVAQCQLADLGTTYRALQTDGDGGIAVALLNECAGYEQELADARAALGADANADMDDVLDELDEARYAAHLNPDDETLEQAFTDAVEFYTRVRARDRAMGRLANLQQVLQYARLVHMNYEYGAEL